jgi:hypothetical protein
MTYADVMATVIAGVRMVDVVTGGCATVPCRCFLSHAPFLPQARDPRAGTWREGLIWHEGSCASSAFEAARRVP